MLNYCRHILASVLLRRQHITVLSCATLHPYRSIFGDSETLDGQSKLNLGPRQSKQLHKVSKASDSHAGDGCRVILHMPAALPSFHTLDHSRSIRNNHGHVVVRKR